jgi:hypothetical protein
MGDQIREHLAAFLKSGYNTALQDPFALKEIQSWLRDL